MKNGLAEVVDKTVIMEVDAELSLCSCESDVVGETCSLGGNDTCRSRMLSTKEGFVEVLEFTHFARIFKFNRTPEIGKKKEISHEIKVSVVMELV